MIYGISWFVTGNKNNSQSKQILFILLLSNDYSLDKKSK